MLNSGYNATSSLKPPSSAAAGRGFISCLPKALYYANLSLSVKINLSLLVYQCGLQNPAVIRFASAFHSESPTGNVSFDCIRVLPDCSGLVQGTPGNYSRYHDYGQDRGLDLGKLGIKVCSTTSQFQETNTAYI